MNHNKSAHTTPAIAPRWPTRMASTLGRKNMISQTFDDLSHALRVLLEARLRANELFFVDYLEAVGNMEAAFSGVLDSFHSVYDAMQKEEIGNRIDWYATPELCFILALRNARHHNLANKIRTIFRYHEDTQVDSTKSKDYLIVNFPPGDEDATSFDLPISLGDIDQLLNLPPKVSRLRASAKPLIWEYLSLESINESIKRDKKTFDDVFVDVVSMIVNAGIVLRPSIEDKLSPKSLESKHFDVHFKVVPPAKMNEPIVEGIKFFRPTKPNNKGS